MTTLTPESEALFTELGLDAPNWSGNPLVGGNVRIGPQRRGNLTDLKTKELLYTDRSDGCEWVFFTDLGVSELQARGVPTTSITGG